MLLCLTPLNRDLLQSETARWDYRQLPYRLMQQENCLGFGSGLRALEMLLVGQNPVTPNRESLQRIGGGNKNNTNYSKYI